MQNSSAFQYLSIDQIHESTTNPRQSFDAVKLEELAESIRQHGIIQPITVRPNNEGFEIVAGARRYRAAMLAELFSVPARIVDLDDAQAMEWQLVENSQRADVHPYEEAQGFDRLLQLPGYDVATLVAKSGKSASHIYARLSLLQLIPSVAQAFVAERITVSHANLIARLPAEHQQTAFDNCWRKDWQDTEAHLLPARSLTAWIQSNLYLNLADAPFDRSDATLNPEAGSCVSCPKRSGYNTSLFADVEGDQCLNAACFQTKVYVHIDRQIAARPELIQIETSWRSAKDHRPEALNRNQFQELDAADNPDAEAPCPHTHAAIVVFGRQLGHTVMVCTEPSDCPVHNPQIDDEEERYEPAPVMPEPSPEETEEEAAERIAEHERQVAQFEADRQQREAERRQEQERQQQEHEAEQQRREALRQARQTTFDAVLARVPPTFDAAQMRFFLRLLVNLDVYNFLEGAARHFGTSMEDNDMPDEEIVLTALEASDDAGLSSLALRMVLSEHMDIPRDDETDWLAKAESVFPSVQVPTDAKKSPSKAKASAKSSRNKAA